MTEREKIIEIIESNKLCILDMDCNDCPYKDKFNKTYSCGSYKLADALIEAGIGDVSEYKKTSNHWLQLYSECCNELANKDLLLGRMTSNKHRAEVAERAFDNTMKVFHEILSAMFPDTKIDFDKWKKDNLANAEKELAEERKDG